ncbi:unnamed protein product [Owenia fusiformis]|uniref:Histone deacetylase n=1 Tax=Owenia fusiformis TaxID=6347 RepID=A0A8S4Q343_OWEFU|nr:unnamed protein product [Owenia fusiformis]
MSKNNTPESDSKLSLLGECNNNKNYAAMCKNKSVTCIYSNEYMRLCDTLPNVIGRASMVHSLMAAYGLIENLKMEAPKMATTEQLATFHSPDYITMVQQLSLRDDDEKYTEEAEQYGLTYECPVSRNTFNYAALVAGASIQAAQQLIDGTSRIGINWYGGWHHAKRDEASGFCYFNDAVLAIFKLREKYDRVLYVDLDLHHGDGVEDAFCATSKVMTVSFHKFSPGFFPGTGDVTHVGLGKGKFYSVNVPLREGIHDKQFISLVTQVLSEVKSAYKPQAVVCQCGADGLTRDPMSSFNLTLKSLGESVKGILAWDLPTLLLGGGGYNIADTARCWTYLTSIALQEDLPDDIPEHRYFTKYGPEFELHLSAGFRTNKNDAGYLQEITDEIMENLEEIR